MMQKPAEMCHNFILVREVTKSHWVKCTKFVTQYNPKQSQWYIYLKINTILTWESMEILFHKIRFSEVLQKYVQLQKN